MSPLARGSISPAGFGHDSKVYAAFRVKERTQLPVICVSNIFTGEEAESILAKGLVDMVAVGRGHLADPAWAGKTLAGEKPVACRRCTMCKWFRDGKLCPARTETLAVS